MSLANIIVQPGRAVLQADAAATFPDGSVAWLESKLRVLQCLPVAFTMRGLLDYATYDKVMAERPFHDVVDFLRRLPDALRKIYDRGRRACPDASFCCYVAPTSRRCGR